MTFQGNLVDLVVVGVVAYFVWDGWQKGIFILLGQLGSFVGAVLLAFRFYASVTPFLMQAFSLSRGLAQAMAFLLIAYGGEELLVWVFNGLVERMPHKHFPKWWRGGMSLPLSAVSGLVMAGLLLSAVTALPVKPKIKQDVAASPLGGWLVRKASGWEREVDAIFGEAARETLSFLTIPAQSPERLDLGFELTEVQYEVDEAAEQEIFRLVNQERGERGLRALTWEGAAVGVARGHSEDMARRGYFSHVSPEGKTVGDRLTKAGVDFSLAGENLALAPTVELVHEGLMASEGHRENILAPDYRRGAIGVIDTGVYGKMVTQVFLD
ncbi:MAG: CvpA family protein [Candidatus Chisholmbacteria bacterium]|nr:CvpA family protein [Candidatus Chisholmbacteria bacterium]